VNADRTPGETGEPTPTTTARVRLDATVSGRVQGVGFRIFVARTATGLGLTGWVANAPDRTVRCVAEGDRAALGTLLTALGDGPPGARVDQVRHHWLPAGGSDTGRFEIRSAAHSGD
jgi:acylphosphatase